MRTDGYGFGVCLYRRLMKCFWICSFAVIIGILGALCGASRAATVSAVIEPPEAVAAGAQWQLDGGLLRDSGEVIRDVAPGNHKITYTDIPGFTTAKKGKAKIKDGRETIVTTGTYTALPTFAFTGVIEPAGAVADGAQWQLEFNGEPFTDYTDSGETLTIPGGQYTVVFKDILGWSAPGKVGIQVKDGAPTSTTGVYTAIPSFSVAGSILPAEAALAGAQWRLTTGPDTTFKNSGESLVVPGGTYTMRFRDILGWSTPADQVVKSEDGSSKHVNGMYVALPDFTVTGFIEPAAAVAAGGQWRLDQGPDTTFQDSGAPLTVPAGTYNVVFKDVSGWTTPGTQSITEQDGNPVTVTGTYEEGAVFFGVTDVSWHTYDPYFVESAFSSFNGIPILPSFLAADAGFGVTSDISFRLFSCTSSSLTVTVDVYSVVADSMIEDEHVRTLAGPVSVSLAADETQPSCSVQVFENFAAWDGRDDDGNILPPGLYKVKVSTQEDDSWDEEVEFSTSLRAIPRRFLRSPFADPATLPIASDLETGVMSGLYPIYYDENGAPHTQSCHKPYEVRGDALKRYWLEQLTTQLSPPLAEGEELVIYEELVADGNLNPYGVPLSEVVDLAPGYDSYEVAVSDLIAELLFSSSIWQAYVAPFDWEGHCLHIDSPFESDYFLEGYPLYEGPVQHGMLPAGDADAQNYFNGEPGYACRCGDPTNPPECSDSLNNFCDQICSPGFNDGELCGGVGMTSPYWANGDIPVKEDLVGFLYTPVAGNYTLKMVADDMATLRLGGTMSLDGFTPVISGGEEVGTADGSTGNSVVADVSLPAGYHAIEINFENQQDDAALELLWNIKDGNNQNFIFTDPSFIQETVDDQKALDAFFN